MTFQVRLYIHHDNDLIQLHLNGIRMCDVFAKSLEAHYRNEQIQFTLPENMEFKPHKGKVYRIKVTLDDRKQRDLIHWVRAFPDRYKCHCIKNIARFYLGTAVIDSLNGMMENGVWTPDRKKVQDSTKAIQLQKWKKKMDRKDGGVPWIDQVSASRQRTEEQIRKAEEGKEKIRHLPVEEILGTRPSGTMDTAIGIQSTKDVAFSDAENPVDGSQEDEDDFDASLFFEQLRTQ